MGFNHTSKHVERKPVTVTLVNAYSSMQKCGSKNHYTCEVFTGRFRTADGVYYDRQMDGFFYHRYVDEGRKNIEGASITLSDYDQGYENPWWVSCLIGSGVMSLIALICLGLIAMFNEYDLDEEQRKWEREQREKERKERYDH